MVVTVDPGAVCAFHDCKNTPDPGVEGLSGTFDNYLCPLHDEFPVTLVSAADWVAGELGERFSLESFTKGFEYGEFLGRAKLLGELAGYFKERGLPDEVVNELIARREELRNAHGW